MQSAPKAAAPKPAPKAAAVKASAPKAAAPKAAGASAGAGKQSLRGITETYTKAACCVIPPKGVWDPIQEIRKRYDSAYNRWMPHVNLLFPFIPGLRACELSVYLVVQCGCCPRACRKVLLKGARSGYGGQACGHSSVQGPLHLARLLWPFAVTLLLVDQVTLGEFRFFSKGTKAVMYLHPAEEVRTAACWLAAMKFEGFNVELRAVLWLLAGRVQLPRAHLLRLRSDVPAVRRPPRRWLHPSSHCGPVPGQPSQAAPSGAAERMVAARVYW